MVEEWSFLGGSSFQHMHETSETIPNNHFFSGHLVEEAFESAYQKTLIKLLTFMPKKKVSGVGGNYIKGGPRQIWSDVGHEMM